ncbi:TPA: DUF551 domain-containing protein [Salmonella enterica subsp. enterica serovar Muenchen]
MTTITREQQKQILIDTANHVISRDNTSPYSENLRELARIALASLEAEPVAWECGENIILFNPDTVEAYAKRAEISPKPLFAAPTAPVVPDEWTIQDAVKFCRETGRQDAGSAMEAWSACRAAMLQANQRDLSQPVAPQVAEYEQIMLQAGNSPVTQDGWISCSERMPEDEQEVIVHNKLGYRYVSYFDEHSGLFFDMRGGNQMNCIEHLLVTHWRPMPAPPQQ